MSYSVGPQDRGNGGRVRAVTAFVAINPLDPSLWSVAISNGSAGPIAALEVEVYVADEDGNRTDVSCKPAKGSRTFSQTVEHFVQQGLTGGLKPILGMAAQTNPWQPTVGVGFENLIAGHLGAALGPQLQNQIRAHMTDSFPSVLPAGEKFEVLYITPDFDRTTRQVEVEIRFTDEDGTCWVRRNGMTPERSE